MKNTYGAKNFPLQINPIQNMPTTFKFFMQLCRQQKLKIYNDYVRVISGAYRWGNVLRIQDLLFRVILLLQDKHIDKCKRRIWLKNKHFEFSCACDRVVM